MYCPVVSRLFCVTSPARWEWAPVALLRWTHSGIDSRLMFAVLTTALAWIDYNRFGMDAVRHNLYNILNVDQHNRATCQYFSEAG